MSPGLIALIFAGGVAAGIINTLAGGGGLIALPLLIFSGLPATVANGTYRLAVTLQNVSAVATFHNRGVRVTRESRILLLPLVAGTVVGVNLAVDIDESLFRKVLAAVLVLLLIPLFRGGSRAGSETARSLRVRGWMFPVYFLLGIYGGFLQAGIGFLFLALLVGVSGLDLVRANAIKVFLILGYSAVAVVLFATSGRFAWEPALALAAGNMVGGWAGARIAVGRGDRWIRAVILLAVIATVLKLTGTLDKLIG